ncbi:response regulator transcription factor [Virgibacillus ainsalahensis]
MSLSKKDYEKIVRFINNTHPTSSNLSHKAQSLLSQLFHFNHSMFWRSDTRCNMYNLEFFNFDDKAILDYTEIYSHTDVMHPKKQLRNIANRRETVLNINDTTTPSTFIKSEYYQFVKRHQMIDQMVMYFANGPIIYGGIGFARFKGDQPFTQKDKKILQNLSIHLQYLVKNSMDLEEVEAKNLFLNKYRNDELGIIHTSKNQTISFYNETAEDIIETISPGSSVEEFFHTSIKPNILNEKKTYDININEWKIKIMPQEKLKENPASNKYSIYLSPDKKKNENHLINLLSKRESEIFDLILKGYTNDQISKKLWISINTVKKHLQNMYQRLGVPNRTSLIHKLKEIKNVPQ